MQHLGSEFRLATIRPASGPQVHFAEQGNPPGRRSSSSTGGLIPARRPVFARGAGALGGCDPGARLIVYPETGHCPNWERPQRVADDLNAYMRQ